jgi:uroporphyrin-III C-methyltransferase
MTKACGKIYLVGAGPGDPDLLTVKALRALRQCDVVLYDRLVSQEILDLVGPETERIYVGKHEGEQHTVQESIFQLLLEHARAGKSVVRLKGGDPLVFGRGAEEWALAIRHDVEVELIPGVSSAIAVPGLAGIPLTFRKLSRSFAVITGHCGNSSAQDWRRYSQIDTLIILMGVKNRALIARNLIEAGRTRRDPVAFVERGASPHQRVLVSTLGEVADEKVSVRSPAVFVIGEVVRLHRVLCSSKPIELRPEEVD